MHTEKNIIQSFKSLVVSKLELRDLNCKNLLIERKIWFKLKIKFERLLSVNTNDALKISEQSRTFVWLKSILIACLILNWS